MTNNIKYHNSNQISYSIGYRKCKEKFIDIAGDVFAEMLVELGPELLGYGCAAKKWEDDFKERLLNRLNE